MALENLLQPLAFLSDATLVASDGGLFRVCRTTLASASGFFLKMFQDLPDSKGIPLGETVAEGISEK